MKALIVDTAAFRKNAEKVKQAAGSAAIYAVLKGNAYGLGLTGTAKLLGELGITRFAVTESSEAQKLRRSGFTEQEILMLRSTTDEAELELLLDLGVCCTIGSYESAIALNGIAKNRSTVAEAQIKIDTGMSRYGFLPGEMDKISQVYRYMSNIAVTGVYTHFHSAFSNRAATLAQLETFNGVLEQLRDSGFETGIVHAANSSALLRVPESRLDAVRVGSAFLGRLSFRNSLGFSKIGWLEASVDELRWLGGGQTVGYGAAYKTRRPTRIAVLPVGYYHGFGVEKGRDIWRVRDCLRGCLSLAKAAVTRRALYVKINGKKARVLGHVGMLHTVADVTDIDCKTGDTAILEVNPLNVKGVNIVYR